MTDMPSTADADQSDELFATLAATADTAGTAAMFKTLAATLEARRQWHALFDLRLVEARTDLGLPPTGDLGDLSPAVRDQLDERSLAACREIGWPLLDEGQVAAAWMYLRAAAAPAEVSERLASMAAAILAARGNSIDEDTTARLEEIVHVALWEGVDPALGIELVISVHGTCNAITAYEQAVSRLPARRQEPAAGVLVRHLHREVAGKADDGSIHVDVSHLQSVLRIARVCTDHAVIGAAWELACYACRLPSELVYPGEPPFENVGEASRLFFGAQLGHDVKEAIGFFRRAATLARIEESGTLPSDTLVLLLTRLGQPAAALHAALERPADGPMPSAMLASGMLPSLVELATAADAWDELLAACQARGDTITYAATLAARHLTHERR
jgi:hypothetical protein